VKPPHLIHLARGADWSDTATFENIGDLTGATVVRLTIKDAFAQPDAQARKVLALGTGATVLNATQVRFDLGATALDAALPAGHYVYEIHVEFGAVKERTDFGSVRVAPGGVNG
jgi:hypothetical protein